MYKKSTLLGAGCLRKISQKIKCSFWILTKNLLDVLKNKKSCIYHSKYAVFL
jgi:hypothetical protein